jgi:hypothetical protein
MAKSNLQYFQNDWNKTVNWAAANNIPKAHWYPVYQLDLQRYANGEYPMSQAERARAILSSSSLQAATVLPSDNPSPTNVFSNTLHDLTNIFTGLEPTRLVSNIFDEVKNTFEHPAWLIDPTKNTLMQWLPGWADAGMVKSGGFSELASHPLVSFLDVLPLASKATSVVAGTDAGAVIAGKLGMTPEQLAERGPIRAVGQAISHLPGSRGGVRALPAPAALSSSLEALSGQEGAVLKPLTVGQRWKNYARSKGLSSDQANLMAGALKENHDQTLLHIQLAKPFYDSISKLTQSEQLSVYQLLEKSGRTYTSLIDDDAIPVNVRQAVKAYEPIENWFNEMVLSSDKFAMVRMPDGTEEPYTNTPSNPVIKARSKADKAISDLDAASKISDAIAQQISQADTQSAPLIDNLNTLRQTIYANTKTVATDAAQVGTNPTLDRAALGRLFEQDEPGTHFQDQALTEILGPGGLVDQLQQTMQSGDFKAFRTVALKLTRRFQSQSFQRIGPDLAMVRHLANQLYEYSKFRVKLEDRYTAAFHGRASKSFAGSTATLQRQATKAITDFEKTVFRNPPSRFRPVYLDAYVANLLRHDQGAQVLNRAAEVLTQKGVPRDEVLAVRSDPRNLYELIATFSKASSTDIMSSLMDRSMDEDIKNSALEEVQRLRSQGFVPHYIPNVKSTDVGEVGPYNVSISTTRLPTVDAAYERMFDFTNTVYDVAASVNKGIKQVLSRDGTLDYIDNYVGQHLYPAQDLIDTYVREYPLEARTGGSASAHFEHVLQAEWNLMKFDPHAIFGLTPARIAKDAFYIPRDLARSLEKITDPNVQGVDKSIFGKGTKIFRTAVLGYSPRFIAHITFGGSFLVALRISPLAFKFVGDAYRMAKEGTSEVLRTSAQRGADPVELQIAAGFKSGGSRAVAAADKNFHWWSGIKMRNFLLKEQMEKLNLDPDKISSWLQVLPAFTFKFTNFVTNMQRSLVYLDGAASAERRGWVLDEAGHKVSITPERAHEEGMKAAEKVMGDLRQMTPLERNTFTKIMPFYGWTKHILRYVSSYPSDHPYRAMFLSNLANMNSEDVPSALPTRLQLLFFLGSPSPDGSVTALDVRALNPLRDTANYATIGGFLSSLNPAITALPAMVDPSIVFGDNVLYPNLEYNQLYGVKEAAPGGNILTAIEQYIPQTTALDVALGLSAQYRGLRKSDPSAYAKTIFESLGLPFTPQSINVRQMAATNEIDRYQQAAQAATNAWQSGDFGPLAGYPTVPDPLQADYNISPMALEALYRNALAATGQPPSEVVPSLPAPNI